MNRSVLNVIVRLAFAFGLTIGVFLLLVTPWRNFEARVITDIFRAIGVTRASQAFGYQILVLPTHSSPFLATITPSCSALAAILGFAAISLFVVTGSVQKRALAFLAASTVVLACNFLRIGLSTYVGVRTSAQGLTVFHDWVGTAFGLLYVLAGFTIYLWVLRPSNKTLLKEYTDGS